MRSQGNWLLKSRRHFLFIEKVFAGAGCAGERVAQASRIVVEIVRKALGQIRFTVQFRRWVDEKFLGWITRKRHLYRDIGVGIAFAETFLYAAAATVLIRRLGSGLITATRK